jgi:hypothetical protein
MSSDKRPDYTPDIGWGGRLVLAAIVAFVLLVGFGRLFPAYASELCPKYGDCVPRAAFECSDVDRSSLVTRVCYSAAKSYMIVRLKQTDYHYCEIDAETVRRFLAAASMGRFYNAEIKDSGTGGRFSCRERPQPKFN